MKCRNTRRGRGRAKRHARLFMAFPEVDGSAEVYVNGQKLEPIGHGRKTADGPVQKRTFFELDLSAAVKAGDSHVAVRVDNRKITELFLGGILRPVVLIERPP